MPFTHIFTCTHSFTHHAVGCTLSHLPMVQSGNFSMSHANAKWRQFLVSYIEKPLLNVFAILKTWICCGPKGVWAAVGIKWKMCMWASLTCTRVRQPFLSILCSLLHWHGKTPGRDRPAASPHVLDHRPRYAPENRQDYQLVGVVTTGYATQRQSNTKLTPSSTFMIWLAAERFMRPRKRVAKLGPAAQRRPTACKPAKKQNHHGR